MKQKLYILDGTALIYRAHFAFIKNPLINSKGQHISALYGVISSFLKFYEDLKPEFLSIAFDSKEKTFRNDIYTDYKANRPPMPDTLASQISPIREYFKIAGVREFIRPGFEADDLIGSLAKAYEEKFDIVIVSGDKDFAQLVNSSIFLYDNKNNILINEEKICEIYEVQPCQFVDYLALVGDSSDNIPGARGIGPKTAIKLLKSYHNIDNLYERIDSLLNIKEKEKLLTYKDDVYLSRLLATIKTDVDLSDVTEDSLWFNAQNFSNTIDFLNYYEMKSLSTRTGDLRSLSRSGDLRSPSRSGDLRSPSHIYFTQDNDVLDTWFSSWLWPFSTMGWPQKTKDLETFLPTNLLITAPEIIYLWVARMIMATLEFQDKIPFDTVLLHGIVRDGQGRKMSKSLGNSPDPIDLINNVGADALRFSIVFSSPKGQDSYYSDDILETGRNFCNKIWNAFRYSRTADLRSAQSTDGVPPSMWRSEIAGTVAIGDHRYDGVQSSELSTIHKWIYSRLNQVIKEVTDHYENLRYNDAASLLMRFIWDEFCSWYIEMSKEEQNITILLDVMQTSMRLLHPIMPFITEEIWQLIKQTTNIPEPALIIAKFPEVNEELINKQINEEMAFIQETIVSIRNIRKQLNISPAVNINILIKLSNENQIKLFDNYQAIIRKLAKVDGIKTGVNIEKPPSTMIAVVQDIQILVPLEGLIDIESEKLKLNKQKEKLENELKIIQAKLKNEKFVNNAKPEVIEKEKEKEREVGTKLSTINKVLSDL